MRLYDPDGNRVDDGPPAPEDRWVIERLERCGGVFDYDDRLTVRVGRRDDRYAYAVAERETLADAADALRRWRDEDPEIEVGQFVDLLDTDEGSGETDADEGSDETDGDTTDATNSRHPVPTRVRLLNGDTGRCHFDNGAAPSPPAWSDEASAETDYRRNLRLFADPEAGTFRCYLNVSRRGPEQVLADVSVDDSPPEPFLAYCARAVTRAIRNRGWELYDTDEQLVFDVLRGATTVDPRWPYDDHETQLLQATTPLSLVTPTQRTAMGVVAAVREWDDESSLSVAGGTRDGATGEAAIQIGYTPRVSTVTATGAAGERLAAMRQKRARQTIDETLAALAEAVDGERLPNVRAAAWLNDALRDSDTLGDDDTLRDSDTLRNNRDAPDVDTADSVGNTLNSEETTSGGNSHVRLARLRSSGPVSPTRNRLRRHVARLLPAVSACLTAAVVVLAVSLGRPAGAAAALGREVTVAGVPVLGAVVGSGEVVLVWQLLAVTLLPPVVTLSASTRPRAVLAGQVAAARDLTAWLTTPPTPETTVDASGADLVAAVETATGAETLSAGEESMSAGAFLDDRLAASMLALTTRPSSEREILRSQRTVVSVLVAVGVTLSSLAVPLAGAFGRADVIVPFLSLAAVVSLPVSWLCAVVALWRS